MQNKIKPSATIIFSLGIASYLASMFTPSLTAVVFSQSELYGWQVTAIMFAALLGFEPTRLHFFLAGLALGNLLFIAAAVAYVFSSGLLLRISAWITTLLLICAVAITLITFSQFTFAAGHYMFLTGLLLVATAGWAKCKERRRN